MATAEPVLKIDGASPRACSACPWRLSNQGRPVDPHGFYTKANLKRLWDGLRTGEAPGMTCHPTDPRMAEWEGYEGTAARDETKVCTGHLLLLMREMRRFEKSVHEVEAEAAAGVKLRRGEAVRRYRRGRPAALTLEGLASLAWRLALRMPGDPDLPRAIDRMDEICNAISPPIEDRASIAAGVRAVGLALAQLQDLCRACGQDEPFDAEGEPYQLAARALHVALDHIDDAVTTLEPASDPGPVV